MFNIILITIIFLCGTFGENLDIINKNDCHYKGKIYPEHSLISTEEACLKCACTQGSLVCYLRMCPELPVPPPRGCVLLHRKQQCCPQLMCRGINHKTDRFKSGVSNRAEPLPIEIALHGESSVDDGCIINGTIYRSGSATASSSLCEYCFCIAGRQKCIQPSCLAPLHGCQAVTSPGSCCPVRYNCHLSNHTTTTLATRQNTGCILNNVMYPEGERIQNSASSSCSNCFCIQGVVRCAPLSCAPALRGCTPIVRPGECCAASYNCSSITQRKSSYIQSFRSFAPEIANPIDVISLLFGNDVRNRRMEAQMNKTFINYDYLTTDVTTALPATTTDSNQSTTYIDIVTDTTTTSEDISSTTSSYNVSTITDSTFSTTTEFSTTSDRTTTEMSTESTLPTSTTESSTTTDFNIENNEIENRNDDFLNEFNNETTEFNLNDTEVTTATIDFDTTLSNATEISILNVTESIFKSIPSEIETILNSTIEKDESYDDYDYNEKSLPPSLPNVRIIKFEAADAVESKKDTTSYPLSQETYNHNPTVYPSLLQDKYDNFDYIGQDKYSATTYTLMSYNEKPENYPTVYPSITQENSVTNNPAYKYEAPEVNRFSPPAETEGGFIPRVPVLPDAYFETFGYHTTPFSVDITETAVPLAITNPPKSDIDNCIANGREWRHDQYIPVTSFSTVSSHDGGLQIDQGVEACVTCLCFYGDLMCSEQVDKCTPLTVGCRRLPMSAIFRKHSAATITKELIDGGMPGCCGTIVCDLQPEESPTVVLDRIDESIYPQELVTIADGMIATPDPFRDVIRTEPAPDLKSLIGDMTHYTSTSKPTSPIAKPQTNISDIQTNATEQEDRNTPEIETSINNINITNSESVTEITVKLNSTNETDVNRKNTIVLNEIETTTTSEVHVSESTESTVDKTTVDSFFDFDGESALESMFNLLFPSEKDEEEITTTKKPYILLKNKTMTNNINKTVSKNDEKIVKLIDIPTTTPEPSTSEKTELNLVEIQTTTPKITSGVGLLKLAGCNIYGRMYRVGRIISELSGPCLECKCTEIGVQCIQLKC